MRCSKNRPDWRWVCACAILVLPAANAFPADMRDSALHKGLAAYNEGRFEDGISCFIKALREDPGDKKAAEYLKRSVEKARQARDRSRLELSERIQKEAYLRMRARQEEREHLDKLLRRARFALRRRKLLMAADLIQDVLRDSPADPAAAGLAEQIRLDIDDKLKIGPIVSEKEKLALSGFSSWEKGQLKAAHEQLSASLAHEGSLEILDEDIRKHLEYIQSKLPPPKPLIAQGLPAPIPTSPPSASGAMRPNPMIFKAPPKRFKPVSQSDREWAQEHYIRGLVYYSSKKPLKARQELSRALKLDPEHAKAKVLLERLGKEMELENSAMGTVARKY